MIDKRILRLKAAHEKFDMVFILPQVFREHHQVIVQGVENRLYRLFHEGIEPHVQSTDNDIRAFAFFQVAVKQNQIHLFDDMLGINRMIRA